MKNSFLTALALLALAFAALAADINGKWKAEYETPNGQTRTSIFTLKAEGDTLTGTVSGGQSEAKIENGKISGDEVSFTVTRNFNGNEFKISYKGKVEGNELKLTMSFGEDRTMNIVAKKM